MIPYYTYFKCLLINSLIIFCSGSLLSQVEFSLESKVVDAGEHFSINTSVNNFEQIVSMQFTIKWDPAILSLDSIGGFNLDNLTQSSFGTNKADQGIISVSWIDFSAKGKSLPDGSTLFKIYFEAIGSSGSITDVNITNSPITIEITDADSNGEDIGAIVNKATVEITAAKPTLYMDTTNIYLPGSTCNILHTVGISTVNKLTGTLSWDPGKLKFDSICCLHPLIENTHFNTGFSNTGNVLVNIDNLALPLLPKDNLFGICFTAMGGPFEEAVLDFNSNLFPFEVKGLPAGGFKFKKGQVNLLLDTIRLNAPDLIVEPGEIIEIPIISNSPLQVQLLQSGFSFDPAELEFKGLKQAKLNPFTIDSLNLQLISIGKIGFRFSSSPNPITLKSNDTLFILQFKVLSQSGTAKITEDAFLNNPLALLSYSQLIMLPLKIDTIELSILSMGVNLLVADTAGVKGETICLPVKSSGIENIVAIECNLKYDPLLVTLVSVEHVGLPADPLFNLIISPGNGKFSWKDYPGSIGFTLSNGEILLNTCFNLIGLPGSVVNLSIDSINGFITRSDYPEHDFSLNMNTAKITIKASGGLIVESSQTNNPCSGDHKGIINLVVSGGQSPYKFIWSDGSQDQNRINLPDGNYSVTVTDSGIPNQANVLYFTITHYSGNPLFSVIDDQQLKCPNDTLSFYLYTNNYQLNWIGSTAGLLKYENSQVYINQPGQYIYQLYDISSSCFSLDTFKILAAEPLEDAIAGIDQTACEEAEVNAIQTGGVFGNWISMGSASVVDPYNSSTTIMDLGSGPNYFIWTISTNDCQNYDSDTLVISVPFSPVSFDDTLNIVQQKSLDILANDLTQNGQYFIVIPDSLPKGVSIDQNGILKYTGKDEIYPVAIEYFLCSTECPNLCSSARINLYSDTTNVIPGNSDMPNVISPNNDGINDYFEIPQINSGNYPNAKLVIFDKQGRVVFKENHYKNNWNGVDSTSRELPIDTYYYVMWLNISEGKPIKGSVTILR